MRSQSFVLFSIVFISTVWLSLEHEELPNDYNKLCYTCLGRDLESCKEGAVTCKHGCMKVVDEHEKRLVVAKGCTPFELRGEKKKDNYAVVGVTLPWVEDESLRQINGTFYGCWVEEKCNGASNFFNSFLLISLGSLVCFVAQVKDLLL